MPEGPMMPNYSRFSRQALELMLEAGHEVIDCHRVLAKTGDNIVAEILRGSDTFYQWNHYPDGDVYDGDTHSQYYYHAHAPEERPGEHGHFHTFLRPKGMPKGISPAPLPDYTAPEDPNDALSHLVAISMDAKGFPLSLFTTNRWVTGEVWYAAPDVIKLLDCFEMDLVPPSWATNRWITGMVGLFRPQIEDLLRARDRKLAQWQKRYPDRNAFEDRELELISQCPVSIDDQMAALQQALEKAG